MACCPAAVQQDDVAAFEQNEQQQALAMEKQNTFNNYRANAAQQGIDQQPLAAA